MFDPVSASFTHREFPSDIQTYDTLGVPLGLCFRPFSPTPASKPKEDVSPGRDIARCDTCAAYLNPYCDTSNLRWFCSICGAKNVVTRTMSRYRHDLSRLPELKYVLSDFKVPLLKSTEQFYEDTEEGSSALERPLVHIFLVQESMPFDSTLAVIDSLSAAIQAMHPDLHVLLLTFSNRIGIYRFVRDADQFGSVQYVHMATRGGAGCIFEGKELSEILSSPGEAGVLTDVQVTTPLAYIVDFMDAVRPVGQIRDALLRLLPTMFDSFDGIDAPSFSCPAGTLSSSGAVRGVPWSAASFAKREIDSTTPQVMLGPVLEAIESWVLNSSQLPSNGSAAAAAGMRPNDRNPTNIGLGIGYLLDRISALSASLVGDIEESEPYESHVRSSSAHSANDRAPIETCSGLVLHLFVADAQDLPLKSHESASSHGISETWITKQATRFGRASLGVNVWGVTNFESQSCDLASLLPLTLLTGGQLNRCVLGAFPNEARLRFSELFRRYVTQKLATKCILKLRMPEVLGITADGFSGAAIQSEELSDVWYMGICSPDNNISFQLYYKHADTAVQPGAITNAVVVQLAFSFETLAEEGGSDDRDIITAQCEGERWSVDEAKASSVDQGAGDDAPYLETALGCLGVSEEVRKARRDFFSQWRGIGEVDGDIKRTKQELAKERRFGNHRSKKTSAIPVHIDETFGFPSEAAWNRRPYRFSKRLVARRFLRIYTLKFDCTTSVVRLQQKSLDSLTLALIVARQACVEQLWGGGGRDRTKESSSKRRDSKVKEQLLQRSGSGLYSQNHEVSLHPSAHNTNRDMANRGRYDSGGGFDLFNASSRTSGEVDAFSALIRSSPGLSLVCLWAETLLETWRHSIKKKEANQERFAEVPIRDKGMAVLSEALTKHPLVDVMRCFFGIAHLLNSFKTRGDNNLVSPQTLVAVERDRLAELYSTLLHIDAYGAKELLYPSLYPADASMVIPHNHAESPLYLKRDSMMMASMEQGGTAVDCFLLDTGTEIVLYRPFMKQKSSSSQHAVNEFTDSCKEIVQKNLPDVAFSNPINVNIETQSKLFPRENNSDAVASSPHTAISSAIKSANENAIALLQNPNWIGNMLARRLSMSAAVLPLVRAADAGTSSAVLFTDHLIEDASSLVPDPSDAGEDNVSGGRGPIGLSYTDFEAMLLHRVCPSPPPQSTGPESFAAVAVEAKKIQSEVGSRAMQQTTIDIHSV